VRGDDEGQRRAADDVLPVWSGGEIHRQNKQLFFAFRVYKVDMSTMSTTKAKESWKNLLILFALLICSRLLPSPSSVVAKGSTPNVGGPGEYAHKLRIYEEFVRQEMERERIPGITIGFVKDGDMWVKGFGYADLENRVPAKMDSSYRLASLTKSMTAVAVLQLAEKGKIILDAEVQTYVPYFPKKKWPITVRQLLFHLGGLRHNIEAEKVLTGHLTTKEAVAQYADSDLVAEPGTKFSYSSPGYVLLGAVIESASNQSYEDYMRRNIWVPLGMNNTRMDDPTDIIPNRVRGYRLIDGEVKNSQFVDVSNRFAAGGIRSTVVDVLKFVDGLNSGKILSKQSVDLISTSSVTRDGRLTDVGMGWFINSVNGRFTLTNNGGQQETRTVLYNFPKANFSIALAMNFEFNEYMPFVQRLYQILLDEQWRFYWEKNISTKDKTSDVLVVAMQGVFFYGLSHYDRYRKSLSKNPSEMAEAFAYFNKNTDVEALSSKRKETLEKTEDGLSPLTGQPLIKLGSFMVERLGQRSNPKRFETYYANGAITFFADYVAMYKIDPDYPRELRFSRAFEDQIAKWNQAWSKTNNSYVRRLWITPSSDLGEIVETLRKSFLGADVYPYLNRNISTTTWQLILKGDHEQAARLGQLAVDLYPQSDLSYALLAVVKIMFRQKESARTLLKKAAEINGSGAAFSRALSSYAHILSNAGRVDDGLELLLLTVESYPREANLYDSIGEFYLKTGNKVKAIESYKKALQLDPNLESSKRMLEKLTRVY
jgi:CubicO group peptidase (beta-lactamase class C family)